MQRAFESPPTQLTVNQAAGVAVSTAGLKQRLLQEPRSNMRSSLLSIYTVLMPEYLSVQLRYMIFHHAHTQNDPAPVFNF
jgi:hypothetical protein